MSVHADMHKCFASDMCAHLKYDVHVSMILCNPLSSPHFPLYYVFMLSSTINFHSSARLAIGQTHIICSKGLKEVLFWPEAIVICRSSLE